MNTQDLIKKFNAQHSPGAHVIVSRAHGKLQTTTRSEAVVSEAGDAVILLNGVAGWDKFEALQVVEAQQKRKA